MQVACFEPLANLADASRHGTLSRRWVTRSRSASGSILQRDGSACQMDSSEEKAATGIVRGMSHLQDAAGPCLDTNQERADSNATTGPWRPSKKRRETAQQARQDRGEIFSCSIGRQPSCSNQGHSIATRSVPTHFLALQTDGLGPAIQAVQAALVAHTPALAYALVDAATAHLTLMVHISPTCKEAVYDCTHQGRCLQNQLQAGMHAGHAA